nr:hypothetical protein CFP56_78005 [Quercus suber]
MREITSGRAYPAACTTHASPVKDVDDRQKASCEDQVSTPILLLMEAPISIAWAAHVFAIPHPSSIRPPPESAVSGVRIKCRD